MNVEITYIGEEECAVCSSLDVAETFGRKHNNVMRDIRNLDCSAKFRLLNFEQSEYVNEQGHKQPHYIMTRDGFTFLVMGYTGEKAAQFKEAYMAQFNRMERELYRRQIEREMLEPTRCYLPGTPEAEAILLEYFDSFMRWREENSCTKTMFVLYISLLYTFSYRSWKEWISVNTPELMVLANTTDPKTAYRARDALVEAGLIEYKPGKKGKPSEYRLLIRDEEKAEAD